MWKVYAEHCGSADLGQRIEKCSINTVLYCIQYIICHLLTRVTDSMKRIWHAFICILGSINTSLLYMSFLCAVYIYIIYSISFMLHHLLKLWQHRIKKNTLCIKMDWLTPLIPSPPLHKMAQFHFLPHFCLPTKMPSYKDHLPLIAWSLWNSFAQWYALLFYSEENPFPLQLCALADLNIYQTTLMYCWYTIIWMLVEQEWLEIQSNKRWDWEYIFF